MESYRIVGKRDQLDASVFDAILLAILSIRTIETWSLVHNIIKSPASAIKMNKLYLKKVRDEVFVGNMHNLNFDNVSLS